MKLAMRSSRPQVASPNEFDPTDLLARARRLDRNAMAVLHKAYYPEVYRYIRYRLDDLSACEDIAGQVFLQFLEALRKRRAPQRNLLGWLLQAAAHLVDVQLRKAPRRSPTETLPVSPADADQPAGQFYAQLHRLPASQQHFLALRFSGERTLSQAAALMGKPEEQVRVLQQVCLSALQKQLEGLP